jgi:mRNA-degrading endonuclease toxin of MazEF toxin-antitoxin module
VLVVTRSHAVPVLRASLVAPVTRTIRRISTEIALDEQTGLPEPCVANVDTFSRISRRDLTEGVGALAHPRREISRALAALADC